MNYFTMGKELKYRLVLYKYYSIVMNHILVFKYCSIIYCFYISIEFSHDYNDYLEYKILIIIIINMVSLTLVYDWYSIILFHSEMKQNIVQYKLPVV